MTAGWLGNGRRARSGMARVTSSDLPLTSLYDVIVCMIGQAIRVEWDGPSVLVVTLNRPTRLNALDNRMRNELETLWREMQDHHELRCVIVTGEGRGFCSGADMGDLAGPRSGRGDLAAEIAFLPGEHLEVPVVAAVNGVCAGGGLHFVADADLALAGESAVFTDPHVSVGQVSGIEPASLLTRIRYEDAARLALLGVAYRMDAGQALQAGLIGEVVPDSVLGARAREIAGQIAAASPAAVAETRRVLRGARTSMVRTNMTEGWSAVQAHWRHPDAQEGPAAFLAKRQPRWASAGRPRSASA
jgi:enoyl-CoA hydratase/carnithine racemase